MSLKRPAAGGESRERNSFSLYLKGQDFDTMRGKPAASVVEFPFNYSGLYSRLKRKGEMDMSSNTNVMRGTTNRVNLRTMVQIGMLGAVSVILMMFEIPLWFAPGFYKIDLSEIPVLIGAFALGPVAGGVIELVKVVLHILFKGTTTAGVGDFANFLIGCALVVPAGMIYRRKRSRKGAVIGMLVGTVFMVIVGCFLNAFVLLPVYGKAFGMPIDALIGMGSAVNPAITSLTTFVILAVAPFNLLKAVIVSIVTLVLYKYISPILKGNHLQ
jgi:riboflavin transporter FmnP